MYVQGNPALHSEFLIITPLMVLVENGLNSEQVSLKKTIYIENCILVIKQLVLTRVVLISSGLYSGTLMYYAAGTSQH